MNYFHYYGLTFLDLILTFHYFGLTFLDLIFTTEDLNFVHTCLSQLLNQYFS